MSSTPQRRTADHRLFLETRLFGSLDGLRCISILAVLWHHTASGRFGGTGLDARGFLGVDLFFVISGFLIVTLLLRERRATGDISLRNFYARRTLRIFPIYYAILLVLAITSVLFLSADSATRQAYERDWPYLATYTGNWVTLTSLMAIAWSLAAEEQFYLVWPPLQKWLSTAFLLSALLAFIVINAVVAIQGLGPALGLPPGLSMLDATFIPICLGVCLAYVLDSPRGYLIAARLMPTRAAAVVVGAGLVAGIHFSPWQDITGLPRIAMQIGMALFLCACVVREDHYLRAPLAWAPIARIGAISYGMYLLHVFARDATDRTISWLHLEDRLWRFAICLAVTIILAQISFRFYEKRFLRLKGRFHQRREGHARSGGSGPYPAIPEVVAGDVRSEK
jgi:peptidoglycan/LPS O-acetylase OafA/YrhL